MRTVIIGGGLAGLAAAARLASAGREVQLLESRTQLGGRAGSYRDPQSGWVIDNCQHVSMGCCTALWQFCQEVGIDPANSFQTESTLYFVDGPGRVSRFRAWPLPAPFHLGPAFAGLKFVSLLEKLRVAWAIGQLLLRVSDPLGPHDESGTTPDESCFDWLRRHGQSAALIENFWAILFVSALSESLDRIDIRHARKVVVDGFLRNRHGWEVQIPRHSLSVFYGESLQRWLTDHGVVIRCSASVARLIAAEPSPPPAVPRRIAGVRLTDGEVLVADDYLCAVPADRLRELLPEEWKSDPEWSALERIESSPITSVHLWFDRPVSALPHAVFVGRTSQWMFRRPVDRSQLPPSSLSESVSEYCQIVISASRGARALPQSELIAAVTRDLCECFPEARAAQLMHSRVITETRAVFSVVPGIDRLRPRQKTSIPNLFLAGDWTRTGWPSTMESAVRSGNLAAEELLHNSRVG